MVDGVDETGLQSIIHAAKDILSGSSPDSVREGLVRFKDSFTGTLLSLSIYKFRQILGSYMANIARALKALVDAYSKSANIGREESRTLLYHLIGLYISADSCFVVKLHEGVEIRGHYRPPGSIVCVEPRRAVHLVLAGLASPLYVGIGELGETPESSI